MAKVLAFLADGLEDVEALAVIDLLRRARVETTTVSIKDDNIVTTSHGVMLHADKKFDEINFDEYDVIFLPGGGVGTENLFNCEKLKEKISEFDKAGKKLAAICAAPSVFGRMGLLEGKKTTCYPGFEEQLLGATPTGERVVTDGNYTTSKGMGTSIDLGLELIKILVSEEKSEEIAKQVQYK